MTTPTVPSHAETPRTPGSTATTVTTVRSSTMQLMHEELARAQMSARLGEAHDQQRAVRYLRARRAARRAEEAAARARLALARSL
ncbi:hypothetical protein GCM10009737_37010 [Nocardioides lentus]|uniref:Uncharacterized protein n=2 Tax=Nocardioides lentus TaxID=338077 RepID=A0ABP5B564_9ACTN